MTDQGRISRANHRAVRQAVGRGRALVSADAAPLPDIFAGALAIEANAKARRGEGPRHHPIRDMADGPADLVQHREGPVEARMVAGARIRREHRADGAWFPERAGSKRAGPTARGGDRAGPRIPTISRIIKPRASTVGRGGGGPGRDVDGEGGTRWNPSRDQATPERRASTAEVLRTRDGGLPGARLPPGHPAAVRRRIEWMEETGPVPLDRPPFEPSGRAGPDSTVDVFAPAGRRQYPHMKLQVQPWPSPAGFLLSVNTHDQAMPPDRTRPKPRPSGPGRPPTGVQAGIETAWEEAGLPTFLRYLRDYIEADEARDPERG